MCTSNLKQQSMAMTLYSDENDDYFPTYTTPPLCKYLFGGKQGTYADDVPSWAAAQINSRPLNPYVEGVENYYNTSNDAGSLEVFHCPADKGPWNEIVLWEGPRTYDNTGSSYCYNSDANQVNSGLGIYGKKRKEIEAVGFVAGIVCSPVRIFSNDLPTFLRFYWHNDNVEGWGNVLYLDGHVEFVQASMFPTYQKTDDYSFIYNDTP